ncbi:type II toxin-antitoxin system VapC family toxin [Streptosporangium carneum]|uniref:Pilus biogenesis protein n=1 Tax=Streptosporangium carneum TaxID=47481 RepID=A0A9W6HY55_9ACTN|nr:PIN domain-containing protein [Streptosporangium carneum]GLK08505.1 pilus biogenesis protein [Streptosporangium carneum]
MIVVDTGPIVAAAIRNDRKHDVCVEVFTRLRRERRKLLVPGFVAGEVAYMLGKLGGAKAEAGFLRSLRAGVFQLVDLTDEDVDRIADLVERYSDLPLGSADASVVAVAERFGITEVFTIDTRDFSVVRPAHVAALTLIPG